eukprot:TRINITY_DN53732_c0_g1_i1.p3 TRINITY_DN53732_c0_g1~~TRINITY_DN53732_c0_g1_i1.p3  ORF type:complete len:100 (+),score=16.79 TRINITY_DN53732_c0_g1_i1:227-526(+)
MLLAACPQLRLLSLELHHTKRVFEDHLSPALLELLDLFGFQPLDGERPLLEGEFQLTHWIRDPESPRIDPRLVPSLLALWRHTQTGLMQQLESRALRSE